MRDEERPALLSSLGPRPSALLSPRVPRLTDGLLRRRGVGFFDDLEADGRAGRHRHREFEQAVAAEDRERHALAGLEAGELRGERRLRRALAADGEEEVAVGEDVVGRAL